MGDPACHLSSVCLSCGRFVQDADNALCPHCSERTDGTAVQDFEIDRAGIDYPIWAPKQT